MLIKIELSVEVCDATISKGEIADRFSTVNYNTALGDALEDVLDEFGVVTDVSCESVM